MEHIESYITPLKREDPRMTELIQLLMTKAPLLDEETIRIRARQLLSLYQRLLGPRQKGTKRSEKLS